MRHYSVIWYEGHGSTQGTRFESASRRGSAGNKADALQAIRLKHGRGNYVIQDIWLD